MARPRKIYVPDYLAPAGPDTSLRVQQPGYPSPFRTTPADLGEATGVGAETAARIAADNAEQAARIAADNTLTTNLATEVTNRTNADVTLQSDINVLAARAMHSGMLTPADPADTASSTFVVMGLGMVLSPENATRALFIINGQLANSGNNADVFVQLIYGTGTPPANGASVAASGGTLIGTPAHLLTARTGQDAPFSLVSVGAVASVPVWIDLAVRTGGSGRASVTSITVVGISLIDAVIF